MDTHQHAGPEALSCPFHHDADSALTPEPVPHLNADPASAGAANAAALLGPDELLVFPMNRRVVTQYTLNESGHRELRLYYGDKEISFDEPELFAFGERLANESQFVAGSATTWGPGYPWPRIRELLVQLIAEDILRHANEAEADPPRTREGARPAPLPPGPATHPRTWFEAEAITRELVGHPLDPGHLELVIPIFRVAHMALDADGRQVGESNVFPKALRLDVPTSWRTCIYSGTRYQVDRPMNVTALKAMRAHWAQMMAVLLIVRGKYLQRFPAARQGWTVGHLERLSTLVLAVPTYALMRNKRRVQNGQLHPALSSLFRVTDGVRMTMHQMLFVPVGEPTLAPDAPMSSAEIYAYAERNYSFHSEHGVCAGPKSMVEEFLGVLVDGKPPRDWQSVTLDDEVREALDDLDATANYALHGLRAYAAVFSLWPIMARSYEQMARIAAAWAQEGAPAVQALNTRLQGHLESVRNATFLATEAWRVDREVVYADMYEQCGAGLRPEAADDRLGPQLDPVVPAFKATLSGQLATRLRQALSLPIDAPVTHLSAMSECIADFLIREQAVLQVASRTQAQINAVLQRAQPAREFGATEIDLHNRLQGADSRRLPYLVDELESLLGVQIRLTPTEIAVQARTQAAA